MNKRRAQAMPTPVKPANAIQGALQHKTLPPQLVLRIRCLYEALDEYLHWPGGFADWLDGFQRDMRPEREVAIWEYMAKVLAEFVKDRVLSPEARKEAYLLLMVATSATDEGIEQQLRKIRHLSSEDLRQLIAIRARTKFIEPFREIPRR
jgi:hypothetical protein